ncbi:tRNA-ribosyltransferase family protein [Dactylosporangium matsuzakiense]|uniref:tRNA-guanine transglycosylase n=1 Tax=Dactylosporangium matsuzakiense TaxID=53360 RepID=A0A9W6KGX7_9ACTN|nr:tRNA guanosine(34) transglycosylase Tgt [Dactylosporangium matsuzakiense]UWZ45838.1 queuine tRNA-ribosyltransferase family protein [Dactylosporangium matsuzakiense]GLL00051.1 tRNA-guanine transglycosylase [Dactylosporangium matsuzakiense]
MARARTAPAAAAPVEVELPEGAPTSLSTRRGELTLPVFVPDATRAVVRGVPTDRLADSGVRALLVSTAHLALQPGASVIGALGGAHRFMGWPGPMISDSGGFQAFSLLASGNGLAEVNDAGLNYRFSPKQKFRQLTPRSCIETQLRVGADIVYCLDYCTSPSAPAAEQERSVELTLRWAAECREVFDRMVADRPAEQRPLLFAVVQGGRDEQRRARCADALVDIGFDGYGFGGYPIVDGKLVDEVRLVAELLPTGTPLHGLGIGTPENLVESWQAGYGIFDCTLPTRNARRGVLYTALDVDAIGRGRPYKIARLTDERWVREKGPIDPGCDCPMCTTLPGGAIAHMFRIEDTLAGTLASMHNLRFYTRLTEALHRLGTA